MNAVTKTETQLLSPAALEHVLGTGDLSKLTVVQRVEYYGNVCRSLGLNPLTRPFRFMTFQGNTVLYATRDCTDQLRSTRKISVSIVDKQLDGDLFIVTARATTTDHRTDEDVGAVTIGKLQGEARANAIMKCMTKAKRRVTMSICGMGFLDETEIETLQGARTFDAEDEATEVKPVVRLPAQPAPARRFDQPLTGDALKPITGRQLLDNTRDFLAGCVTTQDVAAVADLPLVRAALERPKESLLRQELEAMLAETYARAQDAEPPADEVFPPGLRDADLSPATGP